MLTVLKWSYLILTTSGSCRLQPTSLNHIILLFVGGTTLWPYGGGMVLLPGRVRCFVNNEHSHWPEDGTRDAAKRPSVRIFPKMFVALS